MSGQNARLLTYLQSHPEGITTLEAFSALSCCRLSERIRECERLGYVFDHVPVVVPTREGKTARVVRYVLLMEPGEHIAYG